MRAAKQGRGNESVSGGDREPRLPEPQRDSSAPQAVMRCRFRLRNRFSIRKVTLCSVTRYRATPQSVVVPQAELPATFPSEGKAIQFAAGCLTVRTPTCPRCAACTESSPLLPHAVVVSLLTAGVKGASPCSSFFFPFFFLRRKKNG